MIFNIKHKTIFSYNNAPLSAIQKLRITPMDQGNQKIINWDIDVNGGTIELETYDFQGNKIHLCKTINDTKKIEITSYGKLEIFDKNKVSYRLCELPIKGKFIKVNYDLILKDSQLIKDLLNV